MGRMMRAAFNKEQMTVRVRGIKLRKERRDETIASPGCQA